MTPAGWTATRLGHLFSKRNERGRAGLPTISVTINDGLVSRDFLERKMDSTLSPAEHLLVRKGDIAYNTMRMWQGASGLATCDALVSPAYVVLKPTEQIDPKFAAYLFKHPRTIFLFWAYSYGLTEDRLRLYFADFALIPVIIPPVVEQRKIAEILTAWDRAVETVEAMIANARVRKSALMQQLLTGKRRLPGFSAGWSKITLAEIAEVIVSNVDKKSIASEQSVRLCNYTDVYRLNRIEADMPFMHATASKEQMKRFGLRVGDVLITKDSETPDDIAVPSYVASTSSDLVCGYHLAIIRPKRADGQFLKFLFEQPETRKHFISRANGATRFGLTVGAIEETAIRCPGVEEQRLIGEVISAAESEVEALQSQLVFLRQEKVALMQQLLTCKRRVKVDQASAA